MTKHFFEQAFFPTLRGMLRYLNVDRSLQPKAALFLDRDGVLNRRIVDGYVTKPSEYEPIDVVTDALRVAAELGVLIVVISNQGALTRGFISEADLLSIHGKMLQALAEKGIQVNAVYVCPHHPLAEDEEQRKCSCRKPLPGLILQAVTDLNIDINSSMMIGDQPSDIEAAVNAGVPLTRTCLVPNPDIEQLVKSAFGYVGNSD